jgi:hypothetical protein
MPTKTTELAPINRQKWIAECTVPVRPSNDAFSAILDADQSKCYRPRSDRIYGLFRTELISQVGLFVTPLIWPASLLAASPRASQPAPLF